MSTVAVDFDGVIHAYSKGWQDGSIYDDPMPGAFDGLRKLMESYAVFIHTTRDPLPVGNWLMERGHFDVLVEATWLDVDEDGKPDVYNDGLDREFWNEQGRILVTRRKLPAIAYVDDRGVRFESWDQALADLSRFADAEAARKMAQA